MFISKLRKFFSQLNLFRNPQVINNRHQITNQYISTRIFILTFLIILLCVFFYLLFTHITITTTIKTPTDLQFRKLHNQYNDTLKCPCSNLSIMYQSFVSLRPTFHPICSVNLEPLINALFKYTESLSNNHDFRFTGALQFRLLTHLCSSVEEIITVRLIDFDSTLFVNLVLLDESNFHNRIKQLIAEFIQTIINDFINSLQMIRVNTFGSQFISGVHSNYKIFGERGPPCRKNSRSMVYSCEWHFMTHSEKYDGPCDCSTSFSCSSPAMIYDHNETVVVDGFRVSCFILESLLSSTLECFYNISCLNQLLYYIQLNTSINLQSSKKFHNTDSIEVLVNELMADEWHHSINYTAYFTACQVQTCSYSFEGRRPLLLIATKLLGVIGGLTTILFVIIPIIVGFVRKKKTVQATHNRSTIHRFCRLINRQKMIKQIRLVNLFKSPRSHTKFDIRNEFLSTRIYVILLITILCLLAEYHILSFSIKTVTIQSPSLDIVNNTDESSLKCSCSMITIPFKTFISIQPIFHPICSSDFTDDKLLNTINTTNNYEAKILQQRFYVLSLFCQLTKQILKSELHRLDNSHFLSMELLFENQFKTQINNTINQTIAIARSTFATFLDLTVDTNIINDLLSADAVFQPSGAECLPHENKPTRFFNIKYQNFDTRDCIFVTTAIGNITLDEFYTHCDVLQALLKSSLVSFYNISHVNLLHKYLNNILFRPLKVPMIYMKNATIAFILNTLMLDVYTINISYEDYFNKCHPQTCTYIKASRESLIDITLTIIGIIGGITGILHVLIWYSVRSLRDITMKTDQKISYRRKTWNFVMSKCRKIRSINIFHRYTDSERNQMLSTKLFICLFILILIILTFYTSLTFTKVSMEIEQPSYNEFISLDQQYSSSNLICPCSNINIHYRTFVSFSPKFHQICSSVLSETRFLNLLVSENFMTTFRFHDYRRFAWQIFNAIQFFCDLSRKTVDEQINIFLSGKYVSSQAISKEQLQVQIDTLIQAMTQVSERKINILIKLIRDITYANQIISNTLTNLNVDDLDLINKSRPDRIIGLTNKRYENCNCLTSSSCIIPAVTNDGENPRFPFDGFVIGCYILESILLSSMKCLYSQKCINRTVITAMNTPIHSTKVFPAALNPNQNSSYTINTTFSELFGKLMLETWGQSISHPVYYRSCKVSLCTYTFTARREFTYIITILFGITGGLNKVLQIIVPRFVSITMKIIYRNTVRPILMS